MRKYFDWCLLLKWSNIKYLKNCLVADSDSILAVFLVLLLSISISKLFSLIESICQNLPGSLRKRMRELFSGLSLENIVSCWEQVKWFWCHLYFPVCKPDKTKNIWRKIPICKNSCKSYMNVPSCKTILPILQDYTDAGKYCEIISDAGTLYCFNQENITTTHCLSSIPSKYFHFEYSLLTMFI